MSVKEHKANTSFPITCFILTVSDTRTKKTDKSGSLMIEKLKNEGYEVVEYHIVADEEELIRGYLQKGIDSPDVHAVLLNGGTGIAKRDVTIDVVQSVIDIEIPGFGEIFRMLSYTEDIGSAAILSRAIAGVAGKTAVFSTPGSSGAVKLAMDRLIIPELPHVVRELYKDQ
ncbi:molybdopterin adenylyltransferase [Halobacillus karajensis]|uniref:MogA/MoaB family molybdenum cofactor biosynthesis protein n=1 Tax=Halobacillus karajensis TaxID=195088 RepID=UPI0008A7A762|nr:MogA/MoaB family molybdenum cofactor biosynthesis protein [Halobacillus karajensis]SEI06298.1 molybdopterin adenylyltransferase [Halobacillus karajensis]